MKLLWKILLLLPVLIFMVLVNYVADPAHLFDNGVYEKRLARYLSEGKNVANVSNYNERLLQKYYVQTITESPEVLIIGSSRAMQVSSDLFPGQTVYNASISNAVLQDYFSIIELYRERGFKPKTIVLGLDPWLLNRNNGITRWRELEPEFFNSMDSLDTYSFFKPSIIQQRYFMLLSPPYFQRSFRLFINPGEKRKEEYYPVDIAQADVPVKLSDGSYVYEKNFRDKTPDEVRIGAQRFKGDSRLAKFRHLDDHLTFMFCLLINFLGYDYPGTPPPYLSWSAFENYMPKFDKIDTVFLLTPYHPLIYRQMINSEKYKVIADEEIIFRKVAADYGIKVIGSYDPAKCGLTDDDFYDEIHPRREAFKRIFSELGENEK